MTVPSSQQTEWIDISTKSAENCAIKFNEHFSFGIRAMRIEEIVNLDTHPIAQVAFSARCSAILDDEGVLVLENFIRPSALTAIFVESETEQKQAYFCAQSHSVY